MRNILLQKDVILSTIKLNLKCCNIEKTYEATINRYNLCVYGIYIHNNNRSLRLTMKYINPVRDTRK